MDDSKIVKEITYTVELTVREFGLIISALEAAGGLHRDRFLIAEMVQAKNLAKQLWDNL